MAVYKELLVYKKAFSLALEIQAVSKAFPMEEKFALTDQMRRSSRSVCANLAEGFRKLRYRAHFVSKLTDADMENSETGVWLEFSFAFGYLSEERYQDLMNRNEEIGRLLFHIIENPEKYGVK
ncbi:MAG: diversity-rating retroelement protein bAvd family protein [Flaviaesturariibacter sp.]|nr:diversity-rating retroelement protein bAvd family protein [Flaviaesturariibacter sp.]